jgi:hypothetical protein
MELDLGLGVGLGALEQASKELENAIGSSNEPKVAIAKEKIDLFTKQLEESNPVLTLISDAMTAGDADPCTSFIFRL